MILKCISKTDKKSITCFRFIEEGIIQYQTGNFTWKQTLISSTLSNIIVIYSKAGFDIYIDKGV